MIPVTESTFEAETLAELARYTAARDSQVVARVSGRDVTHRELEAAFDAVQGPGGWRDAIDADVCGLAALLTATAVEYFHGRFPQITAGSRQDRVRIVSAGYAG